MPGQRKEIESKLDALPETFSADEIESMYTSLLRDVHLLKTQGKNQRHIESQLHLKHEKLAFSYPTIFFKTMRGEMNPHIFKSLMDIKRKMEKGELTDDGARRAVIDGAKAHIDSNPVRPKRVTQPGSTVQELTVQCRLEDDHTISEASGSPDL